MISCPGIKGKAVGPQPSLTVRESERQNPKYKTFALSSLGPNDGNLKGNLKNFSLFTKVLYTALALFLFFDIFVKRMVISFWETHSFK